MVAYTMGITAIDPHKYGLLFERFLNPERVSPPDLDIDFCKRRRGDVIEYVRQKYGERCVSGIITFNTLGAKACIRDLCRVHGVPLGETDKLAKLISEEPDAELKSAHDENAEFRAWWPPARRSRLSLSRRKCWRTGSQSRQARLRHSDRQQTA